MTLCRRGVLPPVLGVRGTLLQPHQGVTGGAQGQTSDAVAPLLLRAVTQTVDIKITSRGGGGKSSAASFKILRKK